MTSDERKKLYAELAAPFPEECIERTSGRDTGKGYDTAGVRAQYIINRINEVLGVGCYRVHRTIASRQITSPKGRPLWESVCDMTVELGQWENGQFIVFGESLADGGHTAFSEADSKKGAHTNAWKRACAGFGIGRQAWEGTLDFDDDNMPADPVSVSAPTSARTTSAPSAISIPQDVTVRRLPAATAPARVEETRNRVSSKQLGAVWAIARKAGLEQSSLRSQVKIQFGVQLEFLSRQQASELIDALGRKVSSNGHAAGVADAVHGT